MDIALGVLLGTGLAALLVAAWRCIRRVPSCRRRQRPPACSRRCTPRRRRCRTCAGACRPARLSEAVPYLRALTGRRGDRAGRHADRAGDRRRGPRAGSPRRPALAPARTHARPPHPRGAQAGLVGSLLPAALGRARAADRPGQARGDPDRCSTGRSGRPQPRRAARRPGSRQPGLRPGRAVGRRRAGGAAGPGRAAGAARADLAPLHLQRAGRGRRRHPRAARRGARAADRLRRVHPLPVPRRPLVRDAGRGARPRRALPAPRAGALPRRCTSRSTSRRDARPPLSRRCRCSRWSRTPSGTASSGARARGRVAIAAASSTATSSCGSATTASGSSPSGSPRCSPAPAAGSALSNVDSRLRATFGERYALRIESELGRGDHDGDDGPATCAGDDRQP